MSYFKAGDTISGQEGWATMVVKDESGSSTVEDLFMIKNIEATCTINKTGIRTLGKRGEQHKPNGWTGAGTATLYYATSRFREMAIKYMKTGKPVYFDITLINDDPGSSIGKQTTLLRTCTLDSVIMGKLDVDSEVLDENISFTFDDAELLDEFGVPVLGS